MLYTNYIQRCLIQYLYLYSFIMVLIVQHLLSDRFMLVRKDTVYPNSAWWESL